jgi:hypothetical protein
MLCDGGAYAFSNFEVPTGLIERSRCILGSVCARRISRSHGDHAARLSALAYDREGSKES